MSEKKTSDSVFSVLSKINVNEKTEKKGGFTYLSWAYAVEELLKLYPDATFGIKTYPDGKPYIETPAGCFVIGWCTVNGITREQVHPVLDGANRPIAKPNCFQINTSCQRAITKAIGLHGLGLYIYAGEDLPTDDVPQASHTAQQKTTSVPSAPQTKAPPSQDKGTKKDAPTSNDKLKGIVTGIRSEHKKSKAGKEYNIYTVEIDGEKYQTLFDEIGTSIKKDDEVEFQYEITSYGNKKLTHFHHLHHAGGDGAQEQKPDDLQF